MKALHGTHLMPPRCMHCQTVIAAGSRCDDCNAKHAAILRQITAGPCLDCGEAPCVCADIYASRGDMN